MSEESVAPQPASLSADCASRFRRSILIAPRLANIPSGYARGQTAEECSKSALSDAAVVQLEIYDKDLYLEPDCINGTVPLPVHCNYMGLGQECRGCFMTCDGVARYMVDFADEIEAWGGDAPIIHFCPDSDVADVDEC